MIRNQAGKIFGFLAILVLLGAFIPPQPVQAYDTITINDTWSTSRSLTTDLVIDSGATLTIEPGVTVTANCSDAAASSYGNDPDRIEIIVRDGVLNASGVDFIGASSGSCWGGIIFLTNGDGSLMDNVIQDSTHGVWIDNSSPTITGNTIQDLMGAPSDSILSGGRAIGIYVEGAASPLISDNTLLNIDGGVGAAGIRGADGAAPGDSGGLGEHGVIGGPAFGFYVTSSASPTITGNSVTAVYGGTCGAGGDGGNGQNGTSPTHSGDWGGNGGDGGDGGSGSSGGSAFGLFVNQSAGSYTNNTFKNITGASGCTGGSGGLGGSGTDGMDGDDDTGQNGGNGGGGGDGGAGGMGGWGGSAYGAYVDSSTLTYFEGNEFTEIQGGYGGAGGAGGDAGSGGLGANGGSPGALLNPSGSGGNGGDGGSGGEGGDGNISGYAYGMWQFGTLGADSTYDKNAFAHIRTFNGGNGGAGGDAGNAGQGGDGGSGGTLPGNGGAGGLGGDAGYGGSGGNTSDAYGIWMDTLTMDHWIVFTNTLVWQVTSTHGGQGGNGGVGGHGGDGGDGGYLDLTQGNGGDGGDSGAGGQPGAAGDSGVVRMVEATHCKLRLVNNTIFDPLAMDETTGTNLGGASGNGGTGGSGDPNGFNGADSPLDYSNTYGVDGGAGVSFGMNLTNGSTLEIYNNIVAGDHNAGTTNDNGMKNDDSSIILTTDYNCVWGWETDYSSVSKKGAHDVNLDPLFVDAGAYDLHLQGSSPCVDAGDNSATDAPSDDYDGNTRPKDGDGNGVSVIDIGAYEADTGSSDTYFYLPLIIR